MKPTASRPPAAEVAPVEIDGVIYTESREKLGGRLEAKDAKSGKTLWTLQVYEIEAPSAPVDAAPVYFSSMTAGPAKGELTIENEAGFTYAVDLKTHKATQTSGPAPRKSFSVPQ